MTSPSAGLVLERALLGLTQASREAHGEDTWLQSTCSPGT